MIAPLLRIELKHFIFGQNICSYSFISITIALLSFTLMEEFVNIKNIIPSLIILWPAVHSIGYSPLFFKSDFEDGNLEFLLSSYSVPVIIGVKFLTSVSILLINYAFAIIISSLMFNFDASIILRLLLSSLFETTYIAGLIMLISAINIFFDDSSNLFAAVILPFMVPVFILSGFIVNHARMNHVGMIIGLNLIVIPFTLWLASYLIKGVYSN